MSVFIKSMVEKSETIKFRIDKERKQVWINFCSERQITLTSFIVNSVEGKLLDNERREVLAFIEKQDYLFVKIETNINQVAKMVNGQKNISEPELKNFSETLRQLILLKIRQNEIFEKIYSMLAK
ncbi:hypothetical protein ACM44_01955 [Chryseobacterium koreense CCUG 49689]|uniref:Bacterial mobilisation domain-containing protein n=2 Tax=Weeksellaceae TaxID=2762318 RepID=A0A0J7J1D7_9FLAO|nr:hypothetical protein ACM44_01955 [Chryseobacterium koreense CCUG 49689]